MDIHKKYFGIAAAAAATSTHHRARIGAVIVKKKTIMSVAINSEKSHPLQKKYNSKRGISAEMNHNLHAEIAALIKTSDVDLTNASIYVYRQNKHGDIAMCRPCPACTAALIKRGVRHIHYTTPQGLMYEEWIH